MSIKLRVSRRAAAVGLMGISPVLVFGLNGIKPHAKTPEQLRSEYLARLQQQYVPAPDQRTVGSLWSEQSLLGDFSVDYKAHHLNDTITIQVAVQTTAAQSGTVDSERTLTANS